MAEIIDINQVKDIRSQICRLKDEERRLLSPTLSDYSRVKEVMDIIRSQDARKVDIKTQRRAHLFVILSIFSPGTLLGDAMPKGLRCAIVKEFGLSKSQISHTSQNLRFLFVTYSDFRGYVEYLWSEVQARIDIRDKAGL